MRPGITFHKDKLSICSKQYPTSHSLSEGVVVVTCGCPHPMIIGHSVMTSAEALSFMWTTVLMFFSTTTIIFMIRRVTCSLASYIR